MQISIKIAKTKTYTQIYLSLAYLLHKKIEKAINALGAALVTLSLRSFDGLAVEDSLQPQPSLNIPGQLGVGII